MIGQEPLSANLRRNGYEFSYTEYRRIVSCLLGLGYSPAFFGSNQKNRLPLYLRHDVDFSLPSAGRLARLEAEIGVKATYFLMLRSQVYNLFTRHDADWVHTILGFGHQIGLHYPNYQSEDAVREDCQTLEREFGVVVTTVASHKPDQVPGPVRVPPGQGGRVNAYGPAYLSGYSSDSFGTWRYGHPLYSSWVATRTPGCLLTHPEWWSDAGLSRMGAITQMLKDNVAVCQNYIEKEILNADPDLVSELRAALQ